MGKQIITTTPRTGGWRVHITHNPQTCDPQWQVALEHVSGFQLVDFANSEQRARDLGAVLIEDALRQLTRLWFQQMGLDAEFSEDE